MLRPTRVAQTTKSCGLLAFWLTARSKSHVSQIIAGFRLQLVRVLMNVSEEQEGTSCKSRADGLKIKISIFWWLLLQSMRHSCETFSLYIRPLALKNLLHHLSNHGDCFVMLPFSPFELLSQCWWSSSTCWPFDQAKYCELIELGKYFVCHSITYNV